MLYVIHVSKAASSILELDKERLDKPGMRAKLGLPPWWVLSYIVSCVTPSPRLLQVVWHSPEGYRVAIPIGVTFDIGVPFAPIRFDLPASGVASESSTYSASNPFPTSLSLQSLIQPGNLTKGDVAQDKVISFDFRITKGIFQGSGLVRLFDEDYPAGTDLDLYLYKRAADGSYQLIGDSAIDRSTEQVTFTEPGTYRVDVEGYTVLGRSVQVHLYRWAIAVDGSNSVPGGLSVNPSSLALSPADGCCCQKEVTVAISGLTPSIDGDPAR